MVRYHISTETGFSHFTDCKEEAERVVGKIERIGKARNVELVELH